MSYADDYYDFFCGNDFRLIKIAIKNDYFHAMKVHGSLARTIDLSGGTRKINEILLTECFKMTRIIWPVSASHIKSLRISSADSLTNLDLSTLTNLEELSISNCSELKLITGLSAELKIFNAHGVKLNHVDTAKCKNLEEFNVATTSSNFRSDFSYNKSLKIFSVESIRVSKQEVGHVTCELSQCKNLYMVNVIANISSVHVNVSNSINVITFVADSGPNSKINGLSKCTKMAFCYIKNLALINMDIPSRDLVAKIENENQNDTSTNQERRLSEINNRLCRFKDSISSLRPLTDDIETIVQQNGLLRELNQYSTVMINLLSMPKSDHVLSIENDSNRVVKPLQKSTTHFLQGRQIIIYLENESDVKKINHMNNRISYFSQNDVNLSQWLNESDKLQKNILIARTTDINSTIGIKLLNDALLARDRSQSENRKLIITGDLSELSYSIIKLLIKNRDQLIISDDQFHILRAIYNEKLYKKMMRDQQNYYHLIMSAYQIINQKNHLLLLKQFDMKQIANQFIKMINWLQSVHFSIKHQQIQSHKPAIVSENKINYIPKKDHSNNMKKNEIHLINNLNQKTNLSPYQFNPILDVHPNQFSSLLKTSVFHKSLTKVTMNASLEIDKQKIQSEFESLIPVMSAMESFANAVGHVLHPELIDQPKNLNAIVDAEYIENANQLTGADKIKSPTDTIISSQLMIEIDNLSKKLIDLKYQVDHYSYSSLSEMKSIKKELVQPSPIHLSPELYCGEINTTQLKTATVATGIKQDVNQPDKLKSDSHQLKMDSVFTAINILGNNLSDLLSIIKSKSNEPTNKVVVNPDGAISIDPVLSDNISSLTTLLFITIGDDVTLLKLVDEIMVEIEKMKLNANHFSLESILIAAKSLAHAINELILIIRNVYKNKNLDKMSGSEILSSPMSSDHSIDDKISLVNLLSREEIDSHSWHDDDQFERHVKEFLKSARLLTDALILLMAAVKSAVHLGYDYSNEIKNAERVVEETSKKVICVSSELSHYCNQSKHNTLSELLTLGRDLSNAFKLLHDACSSQYKKLNKASHSVSQHSAVSAQENKKIKNNTYFNRDNLISALIKISDQYIKNHELDFDINDSSDTGFTAGLSMARNEIMKSFISALKSHQTMHNDLINQGLNELMKDEQLKLSLQGMVDSLKQYLSQIASIVYVKKST